MAKDKDGLPFFGGNYILDEAGNPVQEPDILKWGKWFEKGERRVKRTQVGELEVSTVFLATDYQFGDGEPILYETMTFVAKPVTEELAGKKRTFHKSVDNYGDRYHTKQEALDGHERIVKQVAASFSGPVEIKVVWPKK